MDEGIYIQFSVYVGHDSRNNWINYFTLLKLCAAVFYAIGVLLVYYMFPLALAMVWHFQGKSHCPEQNRMKQSSMMYYGVLRDEWVNRKSKYISWNEFVSDPFATASCLRKSPGNKPDSGILFPICICWYVTPYNAGLEFHRPRRILCIQTILSDKKD